jgi:hypothetical protein
LKGRKNKMKILKNKTMAILIAALLTVSMGASMTLMPTTNAHTPAWQIPTYAFINVAPNPIGVGQTATVGFGLTMPPATAGGPYGDRYQNMKVTVTKPDGTKETLGTFTSDDTGGTHTVYTPSAVGTYAFQMTYPGQTLVGTATGNSNPALIGDYMQPCTSDVATLTVQQESVGGVSVAPLPTAYWQTPINAMNVNNWYVIGGAALQVGNRGGTAAQMYNQSGNYYPYTTAPATSHILWTKPEAFGGVLGGDFGGTTTYGNYYSTRQYEHPYAPIIMDGYLYYTEYPGSSTSPTANICVDLFSGEKVWTDDSSNYGGGSPVQTALTATGLVTPLKCGQILDYVSPNQFGGLAYLWTTGTPAGIVSTGTTWNMFDAKTGKYILSIVNGTSMTLTVDSRGNLIGYYVNATAGKQTIMGTVNDDIGPSPQVDTSTGPTLNMWNSTTCIMTGAWGAMASGWQWRPPQGGIIPFLDGIQWRMPIATNYSGNALPSTLAIWCINSGVLVLDSEAPGEAGFQGGWIIFAGYSSTTGQQLWIENVTISPFTDTSLDTAFLAGSGVFLTITKETGVVTGYSMTTGAQVWTDALTGFNRAKPNAWDAVGGYQGAVANGTLYLDALGGDIWSIDMLTGAVNWYTNTTELQGPTGYDTPYGIWPIWEQCDIAVADGIIFLAEGHEYSPPLFLGAQQLAVNATNGQLVWGIHAFDVDSWPVIAYGVMTVINAYDNQIYAYGMGPTKTTVTAPNVGVTTATPITITGTVTDVSAGAQQEAVAANFPNGLPAVSDASMTQFMESAYMQQPMPHNITGVPVTISVTDSNGNYRDIGTTTSNAYGTYSLNWTPDISGSYTVTATFAGTQSYYPSSAATAFYASSPPATQAPTTAPASNFATTTDFMIGVAAIIVVIVIIGAILAMLMLRKRP